MSPTFYEMEGSPQTLTNTMNQLESGNQPNNHNVENAFLFPGNQLVPFESPNGHQGLALSPCHSLNEVTSNAPNSSCRFGCEVLDNCAKARFYARALEFYLLDDEDADLSCPFAGCRAQNFKNPKDMLRHLRRCPYFDKGVFRCPLCNRYESFRVQSSSRCRWNKKNFGQKLKNMFRGFTGNRPETQKPVQNGLCCRCSAPLEKLLIQGAGHSTQFIETYPPQSTTSAIIPSQIELDMLGSRPCELESPYLSELSAEYSSAASRAGNSSSENSPTYPQPQPEYNNIYVGSGVSSATASLDGNIVNTDISPGSSHHEEVPITICPHNSGNVLKSATHRLTGYCGEAGSNSGIRNQRSTSLYENVSTSHSLGPLDSLGAGILIGSANLPTTLTPHVAPPKLRIETSPPMLNFHAPAQDYGVSLFRSQTVNHPATAGVQTAASLPMSLTYSQPSGVSTIHTLPPGDNIFIAQSYPSSPINPSLSASPFSIPNSHQTSPGSSPSEQELECPMCSFRPSGVPARHKAYLQKHMKSVHGKRPSIRCSHCVATFTRSDNMLAHCRREHSTSPSKRRRGSSDSAPSSSHPKRRGAVRGRKPCE